MQASLSMQAGLDSWCEVNSQHLRWHLCYMVAFELGQGMSSHEAGKGHRQVIAQAESFSTCGADKAYDLI